MDGTKKQDTYLTPCLLRTNKFKLADIISTVEFDHTGNYLATGDKGGRVVLFERNETVCHNTSIFSKTVI